ncbi:MAG: type I-E CRISPR-associated endoribonuclease Cas2e [Eubacteriales bacterium]|nr:type I-E CRISPR-associated endoribonuclease Cas2e [Eubacteriales bacterium]
MVVVTLHNCPPKLRGELTLWLQEIDTGVYVGHVSGRIRDKIWERICKTIKNGTATMIYKTRCEQRFEYRLHNSKSSVKDFDGLKLFYKPEVKNKNLDAVYVSKQGARRKARHIQKARQRKITDIEEHYIIVDLETTGLSPTNDTVIEVGLIEVEDGKNVNEWSAILKSNTEIPAEIQKMTGITKEIVDKEGIEINEAVKGIKEFIRDLPLVGHNISFDISFLRILFLDANLRPPTNRQIDTVKLAKDILKEMRTYKLKDLADKLELKFRPNHRALDDARAVGDLYVKLNEIAEAEF